MNSGFYFTERDFLDYEKASRKVMVLLTNILNSYCKDKSFNWMISDRIKSIESINDKIEKKMKEKKELFDIRRDLLDIAGLRVIFCDNGVIDNYSGNFDLNFSSVIDNTIRSWTPDEFNYEFRESLRYDGNYNVENIYKFVGYLMDYHGSNELAFIKDYIKYQKSSGYQSIHVIVNVPIETIDEAGKKYIRLCPVEIQFRNYTQHLFDEYEHDRYKKKNVNVSDDYYDQARDILCYISSQYIAEMDSKNTDYFTQKVYKK